MRRLYQPGIGQIRTNDDAAGIEIIIKGLALPQEFRAENDILRPHLLPDFLRVSYRDSGLDDHNGMGIVLHHQLDNGLYRRRVKKIPLAVLIGRRGNNHDFRIPIRRLCVHGGREIQILLCQILLYIFILDR